MGDPSRRVLAGIRVIDASGEYGAYGGRLLAGLGAEVIRVETSNSGGFVTGQQVSDSTDDVDFFEEYVNAGKRIVPIDLDADDGLVTLAGFIEAADVLIHEDDLVGNLVPESNSELLRVKVSPFGHGQDPAWSPVDDLLVMAAGGLLHLGGYKDTGPVVAFGSQSRFAAGIFTAVAVLAGLIQRERTGERLSIDVSAQESIAQALEDSVPEYALNGTIREAQGDDAREAGTGVYRCADGFVSMVAGRLGTARAWAALVEWLREAEPAAHILEDSRWSDFSYRQTDEANAEFRRIFEVFASDRTKEDLYRDAQSRQIALSPVNTVADVLKDKQLAAREFFVGFHHESLRRQVVAPGPPVRMSLTPLVRLGASSAPAGGVDASVEHTGTSGAIEGSR